MNQVRKNNIFVEKTLKIPKFSPGKFRPKILAKFKGKVLKSEIKKGRKSEIPFLKNSEVRLDNKRNSNLKERTRSGSSRSVHQIKPSLVFAKSPQPSSGHKKNFSSFGLTSKNSGDAKKVFKMTKSGKVKLKTPKNTALKNMTDEFNSAVVEVDLAGSGFLNYSQFCKVLNLLKFIENSFNKSGGEAELVVKAWKHLNGYISGKIRVKDLYNFLLSVLNFQSDGPVQVKTKKPASSPKKEVLNVHKEFQEFYLHRITPKVKKIESLNSSSSQEISTEILVTESPPQILETGKEEPESHFLNDRFIRKISLKDLSNISNHPSKQISSHQTGPSICESPKNTSLSFLDHEEVILRKTFSSPKDQSKNFIFKIEVRRVNSKGESDFSRDFNSSVISRTNSFKGKPDDCSDLSCLNNSELNGCQTAFKKYRDIPVIFEGQSEDIRNEVSDAFIENLHNNN